MSAARHAAGELVPEVVGGNGRSDQGASQEEAAARGLAAVAARAVRTWVSPLVGLDSMLRLLQTETSLLSKDLDRSDLPTALDGSDDCCGEVSVGVCFHRFDICPAAQRTRHSADGPPPRWPKAGASWPNGTTLAHRGAEIGSLQRLLGPHSAWRRSQETLGRGGCTPHRKPPDVRGAKAPQRTEPGQTRRCP